MSRTTHRMAVVALAAFVGALPAAAQDEPARPCEAAGPYDDFDFWVGEWDVFVPDGREAGQNRIEKIEGGCLLLESWTGRGGVTGTSINFFDPSAREWVQQWVSADGGLIAIRGGLVGSSMRLTGSLISSAGESQPFRGTWTPNGDGSVRQFFEVSSDSGRSWSTWFDGTYVRR